MSTLLSARRSEKSPVLLVVIGIVSVQLGAGIATSLFDRVDPTTITWLRLVTSALVLLAWSRPRLGGRSRRDWAVVLGFGLALGTMNWAIYQSFARIPLGVAVTLEFAGPLTLAVVGSHRVRDLAWVGLAGVGVLLLGLGPGELTWSGVGFALLAGAAWASYILLSRSTGARWPGMDGLAVASTVAAVLLTPMAARYAADLHQGRAVLLGALVGLLSSVVPYSCELIALRSIRPAVFGILMSLEPAAAALAGLLVVHQTLSAWEWLAVACVIAASVGATRDFGAEPAA